MKNIIILLAFLNCACLAASEPPLKRCKHVDKTEESIEVNAEEVILKLNSRRPSDSFEALSEIESRIDLTNFLIDRMLTPEWGFRKDIAAAIFIILRRRPYTEEWIKHKMMSNPFLIFVIKLNNEDLYKELMGLE